MRLPGRRGPPHVPAVGRRFPGSLADRQKHGGQPAVLARADGGQVHQEEQKQMSSDGRCAK